MKPTLVVATFVLLLVRADAMGQSSNPSTGEMHRLQNDFVAAVRRKDTAKFLSYIETPGVAFGIDAPLQSRDEIADEFRMKTDAYCFLFDSPCLRLAQDKPTYRGGHKNRLCSVYELLTVTKNVKVVTRIGSYQGKQQAYLSIAPQVLSCSNGSEPVEFIFTRFESGWKLVAVPFS